MIATLLRRQCIRQSYLLKNCQGKILYLTHGFELINFEKLNRIFLIVANQSFHSHLRNFSAPFNMTQAALDNIPVVDIDKEGSTIKNKLSFRN